MAAVEAIATTYLEADAASITFSSIPSTYEHLQLRCSLHAANASTYEQVWLQFGTGGVVDTGSNYSMQGMRANSTSPSPRADVAITKIYVFYMASGSQNAANSSLMVTDLFNYSSTTKKKVTQSVLQFNGSSSGYYYSTVYCGSWTNTGAVSDIKITPSSGNFGRGTTITLYGWNNS